jgi:hypothetical protein
MKQAEWGGHVASFAPLGLLSQQQECNVQAQLPGLTDNVECRAFRRFGRGALSRNTPLLLCKPDPKRPARAMKSQMKSRAIDPAF